MKVLEYRQSHHSLSATVSRHCKRLKSPLSCHTTIEQVKDFAEQILGKTIQKGSNYGDTNDVRVTVLPGETIILIQTKSEGSFCVYTNKWLVSKVGGIGDEETAINIMKQFLGQNKCKPQTI